MIVTVSVTKDDLIAGKPNDTRACPIALGLMRVLDVELVQVEAQRIKIIPKDGASLFVNLEAKQRDFIGEFDFAHVEDAEEYADIFDSFEFQVDVPEAFVRA
jgi:hypothetical protein